jgi:hypothetical protein
MLSAWGVGGPDILDRDFGSLERGRRGGGLTSTEERTRPLLGERHQLVLHSDNSFPLCTTAHARTHTHRFLLEKRRDETRRDETRESERGMRVLI